MAMETQKGIDFEETLKLFNQRAAESEERLARLESALKSSKGTENRDAEKEELLEKIRELEGKLEDANSKEKKHVAEIEKLKYRQSTLFGQLEWLIGNWRLSKVMILKQLQRACRKS